MATLKAVFAADGATTAANSSQISDGAAALLIASRAYAKQHGLKPRARFVSTAVAAADPVIQFTAVLDATRKALKESGLTLDDIDLFEVNEAFGGVPLMFQQEFGILDDRLNVNGGSIAIGHPLGSTGARMLTDLLCELERRGGRYGLQTICEASGTANATIIERRMSGATMSEASEVLVSRDGAIATLTINRPRARTANRAVFDGLRAQLVQLRDDDTVRAVIITGAEGVFCAGADITAFDALRAEPLLGDRAAAGGHFGRNWSASPARHRSGGKARAGRRHRISAGLRHRDRWRVRQFRCAGSQAGRHSGCRGTQRLIHAIGKSRPWPCC